MMLMMLMMMVMTDDDVDIELPLMLGAQKLLRIFCTPYTVVRPSKGNLLE